MPVFVPMPGESLWYEHHHPEGDGVTFVFVNALLGSAARWEAIVAPALRAAGHGTLAWDYRGQADSHTAEETELTPDLMVGDLEQLVAELGPRRPVLVGLAHGGLFAARAVLAGLEAEGLVLIDALRRPVGGTEAARPGGGARLARLLRDADRVDWDLPWERLALPVLVIEGLADRPSGGASPAAALAARLPDARAVELAGVGHDVPGEAPEATIDALLGFADDLASRRG
ncbi:Lysophospholipase, alpha-beta hydrolase superfamily [Tistlia consotensis]|uniref:Lysophospholipase, alpha-beta hydrolase superfamily n=1 Tax=Tistlia consotensis USBA 355 TaxID=560819 RepID=A0A1Y6C4I9_9PROT|nr:alpha/beta fold hydrolase [Tistlia consotensis]SMF33684.1 Lysophospholipase, alpha-beta hydrolase superfamily [Tistlia consotensis USBA 355]SNR70119.1 Lysophospholipase, alpha-beta hydrolase superfamily [Tistlia consotensis]